MAHLSHTQLLWRGRIESGLRIAAPFLDLLLATGDRVSRVLEPGDETKDIEPGAATATNGRTALTDGHR